MGRFFAMIQNMLLSTCCALFLAITMPPTTKPMHTITLDYETQVDPALQAKLEAIDVDLRKQFDMTAEQTAAGVLDLNTGRLAMVRPDREEYAASIPKIGIL